MRDRGVDLDGKGVEEELGSVEREEMVIRRYYMKKINFQIKGKKSKVNVIAYMWNIDTHLYPNLMIRFS